MGIYVEKRKGLATGRLVIEAQREGKRIRLFASSRKQANQLDAEVRAGLHDNGPKIDDTHGDMSLKSFCIQAEALWDGTRDATQSVTRLRGFLDVLARVIAKHKLPLSVRSVRTTHITEASTLLQTERGLKPGTVNRYVSAGSKAFSWALDQEIIEHMPKFPWKDEGNPTTFYLTEDAEAKMITALKDHGNDDCLLIMQVQIASGCRIRELLGLKPEDIEDDGDGFYTMRLGITKNGSERVVCIPADLGSQWLALVIAGLPSYQMILRRMKKARGSAGLPMTQPTHAHRHTTATRMATDGINAMVMADFMGHQSLNTTRRYVHNDTSSKKEVLKKMMRSNGS